MANMKNIIKQLTGEQLIQACSMVMEGTNPNMAHIRDVTHTKSTASLENIFLIKHWDALLNGKDKELVKMFTDFYKEWTEKIKADPKADKEIKAKETIATYALASVIAFLIEAWEMWWQRDHATPKHIDDRAPGLVVPGTAYATQEEIIDMANNGQLKVQVKN